MQPLHWKTLLRLILSWTFKRHTSNNLFAFLVKALYIPQDISTFAIHDVNHVESAADNCCFKSYASKFRNLWNVSPQTDAIFFFLCLQLFMESTSRNIPKICFYIYYGNYMPTVYIF